MSKNTKTTLGLAGGFVLATAFSTSAFAVCVTAPTSAPVCVTCDGPRTGTSTLPPLSSYFEHQTRCGASTGPSVLPPLSSYDFATPPTAATVDYKTTQVPLVPISSYPVMSGTSATSTTTTTTTAARHSTPVLTTQTQTAPAYPQISDMPIVTSTYQREHYSHQGFSGRFQGLGQNELLHPTHCPATVQNAENLEVLGCYNVVQTWTPPQVQYPAAQNVFYRIVRPIIYVRYPAPSCNLDYCNRPPRRSRYGA